MLDPTPQAIPSIPTDATGAKPKVGKIVVDRNLCIGAASCVVMASNTFELDAENKAIVKDPAGNSNDEIWQAAESCPTKAILLYDEAGKQVYP